MTEVEWRTVPGFEAYEVSSEGEIRRDGRELKQTRHHTGYLVVSLSMHGRRRSMRVHRAVALAFHGEPEFDGAQARHLDGDKENNAAANLRWGTGSENTRDQVAHGTHRSTKRGSAEYCSRGHLRTPENTMTRSSGRRDCRECKRIDNHNQYVTRGPR